MMGHVFPPNTDRDVPSAMSPMDALAREMTKSDLNLLSTDSSLTSRLLPHGVSLVRLNPPC